MLFKNLFALFFAVITSPGLSLTGFNIRFFLASFALLSGFGDSPGMLLSSVSSIDNILDFLSLRSFFSSQARFFTVFVDELVSFTGMGDYDVGALFVQICRVSNSLI